MVAGAPAMARLDRLFESTMVIGASCLKLSAILPFAPAMVAVTVFSMAPFGNVRAVTAVPLTEANSASAVESEAAKRLVMFWVGAPAPNVPTTRYVVFIVVGTVVPLSVVIVTDSSGASRTITSRGYETFLYVS